MLLKEFKENFSVERLSDNEDNRIIIRNFSSPAFGVDFSSYVRDESWEADTNGEEAVYIVKHKDNIAYFFTIHCAMLYSFSDYDRLSLHQKSDVDAIVALKKKLLQENISDLKRADIKRKIENKYNAGYENYGDISTWYDIVDFISNNDNFGVSKCYSGIEIVRFGKNQNFAISEESDNFPTGAYVFWEYIVPLVLNVKAVVGCKFLYLYAADKSKGRTLINYYKDVLCFKEKDEFDDDLGMRIPKYDNGCKGLIQYVDKLPENKEATYNKYGIL